MQESAVVEEPPEVPGYDVLARLGGGASATVWRARRRADGLVVALKVLRPVGGDVAAGLREAGLLARVRHPHVLHLYDVLPLPDPVTGRPASVALATQLAGGGSLAQLLARRRMLSPGELVTVLQPVASALGDLHRGGVVHGDLSTGNVLFLRDGMPVVGDLGASRVVGQDPQAVGTGAAEGLVAPEVVEGFGATQESDVYQVGALAWLCLTGTAPGLPYARPPLAEVAPSLPEDLVDLVQRCLASQPEERPDAEEVAVALLAVATPEPVEVAPDADPGHGLTERLRQEAREDLSARAARTGRGSHRPERVRPRGGGSVRPGRRGRVAGAAAAALCALVVVLVVGALVGPALAAWLGWSDGRTGGSADPPRAQPVAETTSASATPTSQPPELPGAPPASSDAASAPPSSPLPPAVPESELVTILQALVDGRGVAWEQADPERLAAVTAPGSPARDSERRQLERVRDEGLRYTDVTFRVEAARVVEAQDERLVLDATVSRAPLSGRDETGAQLVRTGTRTDTVEMVLTAVGGQWLLWSWGGSQG